MSLRPCIIRVWTSKDNREFPGHGVGHVSIETRPTPDDKGFYMSLWPAPFTDEQLRDYRNSTPLERKRLKYFMPREANFHQTLEVDIKAEDNQDPQVTVHLYTLDVDAMNNKFLQLSQTIKEWRLIGSNMLVESLKTPNTDPREESSKSFKLFGQSPPPRESCASLALKILRSGGIGKLVDLSTYSTFTTRASTVVKPDEIINILKPAKLRELQNTEIARLRVEGETEFRVESRCVIL